ncbi:Follistatin- protein 1 [Chamberlinius hualienensis]
MNGLPLFAYICIAVTLVETSPLVGDNVGGGGETGEDRCKGITCRAGRECAMDENGEATCICIRVCPSHIHQVCGSNGKIYDNNCLLHRDACISQQHIAVRHNGSCETDAEEAEANSVHEEVVNADGVVACFQEERDQLRQKIISWLQEVLKTDDVARWTSSYFDLIWAEYYTCDLNKDAYIDASELLDCMNVTLNNDHQHGDLLRALCIDAVMAIADNNHDWKLNYSEFQNCMDPDFKAVAKQCQLVGKRYQDRDEITVQCNRCVCACGNWVCTSGPCEDGNKFGNNIDEAKAHPN